MTIKIGNIIHAVSNVDISNIFVRMENFITVRFYIFMHMQIFVYGYIYIGTCMGEKGTQRQRYV